MSWPSLESHLRSTVTLPPRCIPSAANLDFHRQRDCRLASAYEHCAQLTQTHSKSFFFSTALLPRPKREAIRVLYAFCRTSDDIVDLNPERAQERLNHWRQTLRAAHERVPGHDDPVPLAWHDIRRRFDLVAQLEDELLAGVEMDLSINRYATFADLWLYCYRVASVVGLLSMQIIGYADGAVPYAIKLGVALQLTNILRDIGEDAARNRIYLPREDLDRFGVSESEILEGAPGPRLTALLRFQIDRAQRLYEESWRGIGLLHPDSRLAVATAATVYRGILGDIKANGYDVFTRRASLSLGAKIGRLPGVFWRLRALGREFPAARWGKNQGQTA